MSEWNNIVKRVLKSELVKRGLSTEDLTILLNRDGCTETKSSINSKISRGTFSASFFIHCLHAIGCTKLEINELYSSFQSSNLMVAEQDSEYKKTDTDGN